MNKGKFTTPNTLLVALALLVTVSAIGCGSSNKMTKAEAAAQREIDKMPGWYLNPPEDNDEYLYEIAEVTMSRRSSARQSAIIQGRTALSAKLGVKVEALQKLFEEEVTNGNESVYSAAFTAANQNVISQDLRAASVAEQAFVPTASGQYTSYVLMRLPIGDAREIIDNALSQDEELYIRFKESKAFEELMENLERLGYDQ
ncbi:MAG: hypothetical protein JJ966_02100 [Balneolaceae bacterium]|jgi:hypothetical protein|nr:hypothetical protein [Balneolaceae bacterium]MCR9132778.1 hypothetical protein [bacterium]